MDSNFRCYLSKLIGFALTRSAAPATERVIRGHLYSSKSEANVISVHLLMRVHWPAESGAEHSKKKFIGVFLPVLSFSVREQNLHSSPIRVHALYTTVVSIANDVSFN